jgi:photosystem II stability/assembly factor-like uncharacterized protein
MIPGDQVTFTSGPRLVIVRKQAGGRFLMAVFPRLSLLVNISLCCLLAAAPAVSALEGVWTDLNPEGPDQITSAKLSAVDFISASTGLIVGGNGTILLTSNRGVTWMEAASGSDVALDGVDFIDATYAVAVGANGTILRSGDGGLTWDTQTSGTTQNLSDVHFNDALNGWTVGYRGTVLGTADGGSSWINCSSDTTLSLNAVVFTDAQKGYAVGNQGALLQSSDGGCTWIRRSEVKTCHNDHGVLQCSGFLDVFFLDAFTGFIVGYSGYPVLLLGGTYFRTINGGGTWNGPPASVPEYFDVGAGRTVAFGNATEGLILRGGNLLYHTIDTGESWTESTIPLDKSLTDLTYGDENTAYAVGYNGAIVRWDRTLTPVERRTWGSIKSTFGN